ncbi:MAG: DUF2855 family protein [Myxococcota bacterium]
MSETIPAPRPIDFQVDRDNFENCRIAEGAPVDTLAEGQVLLKIDRFALTSNNISYAAAGDMLNYWGFFPGPDRWGRIPAMGFADVIESRNADAPVGSRCFGFFPMSRHLIIDAKANTTGMIDMAEHRTEHAMVYRSYTWVGPDALYEEAFEDHILLLRGLFMTSFLAEDMIADEGHYGAESTIITSASSKTSIALAFMCKQKEGSAVVGLTSARNKAFVEGLGCYDEVVLYDQVSRIPNERPAVMVDMAGNGEVVHAVHSHLRDKLKYSCTVGATHWDSGPRPSDLPGPTPEFFFAPARIAKRTEDWGGAGLQERLGSAWREFAKWSDGWMKIQRHQGEAALEKVYLDALGGRLDPEEGHILTLW